MAGCGVAVGEASEDEDQQGDDGEHPDDGPDGVVTGHPAPPEGRGPRGTGGDRSPGYPASAPRNPRRRQAITSTGTTPPATADDRPTWIRCTPGSTRQPGTVARPSGSRF